MRNPRATVLASCLVVFSLALCSGCIPSGLLPLIGGGSNVTTFTPGTSGGGGSGSGGSGGGGSTGTGTLGGCLSIATPADAIHQAALDQLNLYRQSNSLSTLQYSRTLEQAADLHAKDLYDRNFFDHTNPDGDGPSDRALAAGFCHQYVGENIAWGQNSVSTVTEVMTGWKNSPGHNDNMLRAGFEYVGIGYYHIQVNGDDFYYWAQLFAFSN